MSSDTKPYKATKGDIVNRALDMLGMNGVGTKASPSTVSKFLQQLEMMATSWNNKGLHVGFNFSVDPMNPDASEESGISLDDLTGVCSNLAVQGATTIGKIVSPELKSIAYESYQGLFSVELIQRKIDPMLPSGSGNHREGYWTNDYQVTEDPITVEKDGNLDDLTLN